VRSLFGVGPERAAQLARLELFTVRDLLLHRPRRYEDRRQFRPIAAMRADEATLTRGRVVALGVKWFKQHTKSIFELVVDDGTGRLHCRWWNLPFMEKYFRAGQEVVVFGRAVSLKPRTMDHPETEVVEAGEESSIHLNRIAPVYPLTEGLPQRWLRALVWRTLAAAEAHIAEPWPALLSRMRAAANPQLGILSGAPLPDRARAVRRLHFPESEADAELARQRLALDEFIELQRQMQLRRRNFEAKARALPCAGNNRLIKPFLARLEFKLTDAQSRVLRELRKDLSGPHPMRRLLQGDVGSGKTVVAACCALMTLESGFAVALMAPTEVLAEQHYATFRHWFDPLGVRVELRTGSRKEIENPKPDPSLSLPGLDGRPGSPERAGQSPTSEINNQKSKIGNPKLSSDPALPEFSGPPSLTIGTHALIESGFAPDRLGLVIIDEQHKFGVAQREELVRKGHYPHLLVMTATPIPRTLGLTVYGELDVATVDEPPPGRGTVRTFIRSADKLPKVWDFVRDKLAEGRQAYVVCPRIEASAPGEVRAAKREFQQVQQALAPFRAGLLHGRLKTREKEAVMADFRSRAIHVLVATSLIEVGLDVSNATVMVVQNAEQFGLAQLHQLRGRIGRGMHHSFCILIAAVGSDQARQRLKVLAETTDGFRIAEADLQLRGPGELLGQQQSGAPRFRFGDLVADWELVRQARELAGHLVE
jgi:ATP-dependent DNA helicase RecG